MIENIAFAEIHTLLGLPKLEGDIEMVEALATPERDAVMLYRLVKTLRPDYILEIGTFYGHTTFGFAVNSPLSKIYTLDIYREMGINVPDYQERELLPQEEVGKLFKGKGLNIVQLFADSRKSETYAALPLFDFIFIDGNHTVDAILADTSNALKQAKKGSVICWHDYHYHDDGLPQTKEALTILSDSSEINIKHILDSLLAFAII